MDNVKKCGKCGEILPLDQFYPRKLRSGNIGYYSVCKDCSNKGRSKWNKEHPERRQIINTKWRQNNIEKCRAACVKWRRNNPDKQHAASDKWFRDNKERRRKYERDRKINNPNLKLKDNIRRSIRHALKHSKRLAHTIDLIGCSVDELRIHLERQFKNGMTWDNYGRGGWVIDHIIPLSYFNHSDLDQQRRAWHYTNLQPLWAADNLNKSNKIIEVQLALL